MPYIVDRSNNVLTFTNKPVKYTNTNYIPINRLNQTINPAPDVYNYPMHDLSSVFTHWDEKIKCNVPTPNELPNGVVNNK